MLKFPKHVLTGIAAHLEAEKRRIGGQISDLSEQDPFTDTDRLVDNAASDTEAKEEINHERYQAMLSELKQKQGEIDSALLRIERGTYGFCTNCGTMINTERLAAMPTATLCMDCEAKRKR